MLDKICQISANVSLNILRNLALTISFLLQPYGRELYARSVDQHSKAKPEHCRMLKVQMKD